VLQRITNNPVIPNGQTIIRWHAPHGRPRLQILCHPSNWDDLRRDYPKLDPEDIRTALAARNLTGTIKRNQHP
jgi:hypothetical protein